MANVCKVVQMHSVSSPSIWCFTPSQLGVCNERFNEARNALSKSVRQLSTDAESVDLRGIEDMGSIRGL